MSTFEKVRSISLFKTFWVMLISHFNSAEGTFPLASLESELAAYVSHPEKQEQAFDITTIPKISREQAAAEVPRMSHAIPSFWRL